MKHIYLVALLLASVAFSGCTQLDPEGRAIALADQLPEARLISKSVDSMKRADQCTFDKFYSGYKKIAEAEGIPLPESTESQREQLEAMIQQMAALAKRCQVTLSKSAEKESENVYMVNYKLVTISDPECSMISEGSARVRVDLSTGKAEPMDGSQDIGKYEQAFEDMGECAAVLLIGGVSTGASSSTQPATTQPQ